MRQLVAILFSDMVGYSRQVEQDEAGALARLEVHNRIMEESIRRHEGTVIKTVGDAFVATFPSGVSAVECALDAQRSFELHNSIAGEAERIEVRIGVHAGDVVLRDGDLFGEAVNLAARLEPLAPAGGVAVSRTIYEQIRRKVRAAIEDRGSVALKNIAEPVQVYLLKPGPEPVELQSTGAGAVEPARRSRRSVIAAAGTALAAAAIGAPLFHRWRGGIRRGGSLRMAIGYPFGKFELFGEVPSRTHFARDQILDALLDSGRDGQPVAALLTQWKETPGKLELELRPDLWFHDHPCFEGGKGRRADAEDLAFSLRIAMRYDDLPLPVEGAAEFLAGGKALPGIRASENLRVEVALTARAPFFAGLLQDVALLPRELEPLGDQILGLTQPVGTGPFRLTQPAEGGRIELVRAPRYWRSGEPLVDGLQLVDGTDITTTLQGMEAGEIDVYVPLKSKWPALIDLSGVRARLASGWSGPDLDVAIWSTANVLVLVALAVSPKSAALADQRVRQAVAWAIDRPSLFTGGNAIPGQPMGRFLVPTLRGYDPLLPEFTHDPEKARTFLQQAGHPGGTGVPEIVLMAGGRAAPLSEKIAAQLGAVGLKVRVVAAGESDIQALRAGQADVLFYGSDFRTVDEEAPELFFGMQSLGRDTARIDATAAGILSAAGPSERTEVYRRGERILMEDLPVIPLGIRESGPRIVFLLRRDVRGLHDPATGFARLENLRKTWLDR